ncbi:hypothetical protein ACFVAJ_18320 [Agromyces sp. NPDC057679]|uniref:hypothetical protein n=1 Tax=Agromyces sp. NPDC057679 TaxID=3346207 RepID=UPI003670063E
MGLFRNKQNAAPAPAASPAPPATPAPAKIDLGKRSGQISLEKGAVVTIEKSPLVTATVSWSSDTDYDIYALVELRDGRVLTAATFGSADEKVPTPSVLNGAVRHLGDVGRGMKGRAQEKIEIRMTDEIAAVYPVAYSAQSNGSGSFRRYKVSLELSNGAGSDVTIDAKNANNNDKIYSVAIGAIRNTADGIQVEALELYSKPGSENRPVIKAGKIVMDAGARNLFK